MKKFAVLALAVILSLSILTSPAHAGRRQRHCWEGVAIGLGAAIVGSTNYGHYGNARPHRSYARVVPNHPAPRYYRGHHRRGHWKIRKTWVPPEYKRAWNPGHYSRRGHWIPGKWITLEIRPGYWERDRVRVSRW